MSSYARLDTSGAAPTESDDDERQLLETLKTEIQGKSTTANRVSIDFKKSGSPRDRDQLQLLVNEIHDRTRKMNDLLRKRKRRREHDLSSGIGAAATTGFNTYSSDTKYDEFTLGMQGKLEKYRTILGADAVRAETLSSSVDFSKQNSSTFIADHMGQQQQLREEQDEQLDQISHGVSRLKVQSENIREEVVQQKTMLDTLETEVTTAQERLRSAAKRLDTIMNQMSDKKKICCVVLLVFVLGILIAVLVTS